MALKVIPSGGLFAIHDVAQVDLGTYVHDDRTDKVLVYLKAKEALRQGEALTSDFDFKDYADSTIEDAAAGSVKIVRTATTTDFTTDLPGLANLAEGVERLQYPTVWVNTGTGASQQGIIKIIEADTLTIEWITSTDGKLKTAVTGSLEINVPWRAKKAQAGVGVIGWAQQNIPKDKYFWAVAEGQTIGSIFQAGTQPALTDGVPLIVSTDAGILRAIAASLLQFPCAFAMGDVAANNTTIATMPIQACATMKVGKVPLKERWS